MCKFFSATVGLANFIISIDALERVLLLFGQLRMETQVSGTANDLYYTRKA